jgi:hypothetical protein
MFQYTDEQYPERILQPPETRPFDYPRYNYIPREQLKRKLIDEIIKPIRGIPGRPKDCRPVLKPLKLHNHIPTPKDRYYVICRQDTEQHKVFQERKEQQIPGTSVFSFTIEDPNKKEQENIKQLQRFRGTKTSWKYNIYLQPICKGLKGGITYWDLFHRQITE